MDDRTRQRLWTLFIEELAELGGAMGRGLVALEAESDPAARRALIDELFRHAHTLKGAAQAVGAVEVGSLCHDLEERFEILREDPGGADAAVVASLFAQLDAVTAAGAELDEAAAPASDAEPTPVEVEVEALAPAALSPPAPQPPAPTVRRPQPSSEATVRLPAAKLEALLDQANDLLMGERALAELLRDGEAPDPGQLRRRSRQLRQVGSGLANAARSLRMAAFSSACEGLERLARDVAAAGGKEVRLEVQGGGVELDRPILEAIREPLAHLVRNAVDHGIEAPSTREAAGKPRHGRVEVEAVLHGGRVHVELRDDGAGIDVAAVRAAAQARGREGGDVEDVTALLFSPGFSTAATVSRISGRGVGLDAVRDGIEAIGGTVELESSPGDGMTVRMLLPLTLSSLRVVVVEVAGRRFALASSAIERLLRVDAGSVATVEGRDRLQTDSGPVPLVPLAGLLGLTGDRAEVDRFPVVLATSGGQQVALEVDALGAELEVTVTGLGERVAGVPTALGAAQLPDGKPVVVLSPAACARLGLSGGQTARPRPAAVEARALHVLLADDSLTTRALERAILEGAGYRVTAVADGMQALDLARAQRYDAVVSDVNMPRMDGVTLCERLRASPRHADVPIILVTAEASQESRLRGLEAGANAYLTKQAFDQGELIDTIERLAGAG